MEYHQKKITEKCEPVEPFNERTRMFNKFPFAIALHCIILDAFTRWLQKVTVILQPDIV
jgi:hypothetical protein